MGPAVHAPGRPQDFNVTRVDRHDRQVEGRLTVEGAYDAGAVRRPGVLVDVIPEPCDLTLVAGRWVDDEELMEAWPLGGVGKQTAGGRPIRSRIVPAGRSGQGPNHAGFEVGQHDVAPVEVIQRSVKIGNVSPVGRGLGAQIVAGAFAHRAGPGAVPIGEQNARALVAFDGDEDLVAVGHPAREVGVGREAGDFARQAALDGHDPGMIAVGEGDVATVRGPLGLIIHPVGHGLAIRREPHRPAPLGRHDVQVGGVAAVPDEGQVATIRGEAVAARPAHGGDQLEAPASRRPGAPGAPAPASRCAHTGPCSLARGASADLLAWNRPARRTHDCRL